MQLAMLQQRFSVLEDRRVLFHLWSSGAKI